MELVVGSVGAFLVTALLLLALRIPARIVGLVDRPGGHKTHRAAVPAIGGIAIASGVFVSMLPAIDLRWQQFELLVAAALLLLTGILDDRFDLGPRVRMFAQTIAAAMLVDACGHRIEDLGDLFGSGAIELGSLAYPFTVIAAVALINAFNMLDGVDGLAGSVALVALTALAVTIAPDGGIAAALVVSSIGSVAAFLLFNVPARFNRRVLAFLGDAGSTLMGFALAGLSLVAVQSADRALPPVLILWLLPIPIVELFSSTLRRLLRGVSPCRADRGHMHHRLIEAGMSERTICTTYVTGSAASAVVGFFAWQRGLGEAGLFYAFVVVAVGCWLLAVNARRLRVAARRLHARRTVVQRTRPLVIGGEAPR
jgi:UDP-GlcNAc:undecaprenyl-phosphate GlcNAc-1-phosphate transferase